jgi:spermidine synthase
LYEHESPYHRIHVDDRDGIRMVWFERNRQSSMYLDDPFETDIEYCGYLHLTLAVQPEATRTLVIGLGGGTVVKRMWRDYPTMRLDSVELDPEVADIAREFFALPDDERIRVIVGDGRAFVDTCADTYDIVIVDAFDEDRVPRPLVTEEFMRATRDRLAPGGVAAWNVIGTLTGAHSKLFRSLHRTASNVWSRVWVFPVGLANAQPDDVHNIIVIATDCDLSEDELLDRIACRVDGIVTVPCFDRFGDDLLRASVRTGDAPLLLDPPAAARGRG